MSGFQDPNYKVKNTFVEFTCPEGTEDYVRGRRTRSDVTANSGACTSPLVVASKSPTGSPSLHPVDETMQAVPIDDVDFELLEEADPMAGYPATRYDQALGDGSAATGTPAVVAQQSPGLGRDEPAYIVPTTPSPFLHSAFPPSVVPPFGYGQGWPGGMDMGLPPAYGSGEDAEVEGGYVGQDGDGHQYMQDADGQYIPNMQGMPFMPEMYDPSCSPFMPFGWAGMPMDGSGGYGGEGVPHELAADGSEGMYGAETFGQEIAVGDQACHAVVAPMAEGDSQPSGGRKRGKGKKKQKEAEDEAIRNGESATAAAKEVAKAKVDTEVKGSAFKNAQFPELGPDEEYTTVMLRNIPNKYTREMLIKQLSVDFKGLFDFMYLPIDFKNKCNVGYGFINFRNQDACERFVGNFHGVDVRKCLPGLNSKKIVEVTPARVQGLIENVRRLRNSPVMNQLQDHPEWMPLLFNEHGQEEPFPNPDQPLPPVKPRGRAREGKEPGT